MSDFDLLDRPLLWIPVKWPGAVPGGSTGQELAKVVDHEIELRVEMKENDEVKAIISPDPDAPPVTKIDAIMSIVQDWRRVKANGAPVPFNRENMLIMLNRQGAFFDGFRIAYLNASIGRIEAREGNSEGSPAGGRADEQAGVATENPKPNSTASASE